MNKMFEKLSIQMDQRCVEWDRLDTPGVIVAVIQDGKFVHHHGYGCANLEHDVPITSSTVFDAGSIAKQFTGMAVAMMAQQKKLSLEDDIRQYLPEVPDFGSPILIRHLAHHTSGLRDWICVLGLAGWRLNDPMLTEDVLTMSRYQNELDFKPGAEFDYCNTGYTLLAEIISRIEGEPFPQWINTHIFKPLDMTQTCIVDDLSHLIPNRANSYYPTQQGAFINADDRMAVIGAGSLWSTSEDLAKWLVNYETQEVGGPEVIQLMHERGELNDGTQLDYGLGLEFFDYRGLYNVGHGGQWAGFQASITRFPAHKFNILALGNLSSIDPTSLVLHAADLYLDEYLTTAESEPEWEGVTDSALVAEVSQFNRMEEYAGKYYSPELDVIYEVSLQSDQLVAQHRKHGTLRLTPVAKDEFNGNQWFLGRIQFARDGDTNVIGFRASNMRVRNVKFNKCDW